MNYKLPKNAVLELTYNCNHKCKFCSCPWENTEIPKLFYKKHKELSIDKWKQCLKILEENNVHYVTFSGGEVLLKDGFEELLLYIREKTNLNKNKKIIVISNGALMNEDLLALFKKTNVHLSLSLPGLRTFSYLTDTTDNSPENVLYWLSRAKEEGIDTTVNVTVTNKNYFEFYEILSNGLIAGADTLLINRVLVGGRGLSYIDELALTEEQLLGILDTTEEVLSLSKRYGSIGTEYPYCLMKNDGKDYKQFSVGSGCSAANGFFVVDPSGFIRACNHSPVRVGHIFNNEIIENLDYWNVFANSKFDLPEMCNDCDYKKTCACGCREAASIVYGSLSAPDPCFALVNNKPNS